MSARSSSTIPRRSRLIAAPIGLAVLIAAALGAALGGGGAKPRAVANRMSSSGELASVSGKRLGVVRMLELGGAPAGLSAGVDGELWVSLPGAGALVRVGGQMARVHVGGHPAAIAAGPGGVWVAGSAAGALARFSPPDATAVATVQIQSEPSSLAVDSGDGSVWATIPTGQVTHIDPSGTVIGASATMTPAPMSLGVGEGWVWAVGGPNAGLARVALAPSPLVQTFQMGSATVGVAFNRGVWTAHSGGHVTRFDPRPGDLRVNADVPVAPTLDAIAASEGGGAVYAISTRARSLYRISTGSARRVTGRVTFTSPPVALAVTDRYVWVATEDGKLSQLVF